MVSSFRGSFEKKRVFALGATTHSIESERTRKADFRRRDRKVCFSGVLTYSYEILRCLNCHGARQSIADLRRLSKSPAVCNLHATDGKKSSRTIQSGDFIIRHRPRLTDRRGTWNWGVPCADSGPQGSIGRCR